MAIHWGRRPFAELVFHILAHVDQTRSLPASLYDPRYVARVAEELGPATERALADDAAVLGRWVTDHLQLGRLGLLAALHRNLSDALTAATTELSALGPEHGAERRVVSALAGLEPVAELLRCAAWLEHDAWATLSRGELLADELVVELGRVARAAPALPGRPLILLSSLGLRGRALLGEIWIGEPTSALHPSPLHAAWQAAHEATVVELGALGAEVGCSEREIERGALVLLHRRARAAGLEREHAQWLAALHPACAPVARGALPERLERLVAAARRRG